MVSPVGPTHHAVMACNVSYSPISLSAQLNNKQVAKYKAIMEINSCSIIGKMSATACSYKLKIMDTCPDLSINIWQVTYFSQS